MNIISCFKRAYKYICSNEKVIYKNVRPIDVKDSFRNKVVLITGGTSGIGKCVASYVKNGGGIAVVCGRTAVKMDDSISFYQCDVATKEDCQKMISDITNKYGEIDVIVNSAGIYNGNKIESVEEYDYNHVIDINYHGIKNVTESLLEVIKEDDEVHKIINVLSIRSMTSGTDAYALSKWAAYAYTIESARKLKEKGIIVNGIAPGPTCSAINNVDENGNVYNIANVANYYLDPLQVANLVWYLATDVSKGVVGQIIAIDGGEVLT